MPISVVNNLNSATGITWSGRLGVFFDYQDAEGVNFFLQHASQTAVNNGWSALSTLPNTFVYTEAAEGVLGYVFSVAARNLDGRIEIFSALISGGLFGPAPSSPVTHLWQTAPNNETWSSAEAMGGNVNQIAVSQYFPIAAQSQRSNSNGPGQDGNGCLQLFAADTNGHVSNISQLTPGGSWSQWQGIPPTMTGVGADINFIWIAVGQNWDGTLEVFARDDHGTLFHSWQTWPPGTWTDWTPLGSGFTVAWQTIGQNLDGRLEVFAVDGHGTLQHLWQLTPTPDTAWANWAPLGGGHQIFAGQNCAVGQNADGRLEIFARDKHGTALHMWQMTPGGEWTDWNNLGGGHSTTAITVGMNEDGRLEVFDVDSHGTVFHIWQMSPGGSWSGWTAL